MTREEVDDLVRHATSRRIDRADAARVLLAAARDEPAGRAVPAPGAVSYWDDYASRPLTRAELLVAAAEHLHLADDDDRALECLREAVADGGGVAPDARAHLADALLARPDGVAEAHALLEQLLAERSTDPLLYEFVGESLETRRGDHEAASRWYSAGLVLTGADPEDLDPDHESLVEGRRRSRRAQQLPPDGWDELAETFGGGLDERRTGP